MHVINSSSKLHTLHTEKTIQENTINCKRQEVNDKILSIKVQMYIIYIFSMNFHKVIKLKNRKTKSRDKSGGIALGFKEQSLL